MLRIALCDDNRQQRGATGKLLLDYGAARPHLAVKVSVFSSGLEVLAAAEEAGDFDLYVLDVVMPGLSGIQLGMRLREVGSASPIIYLTVSPEYAVDSYATRAFHYLMKPVDREKLFTVLDRAVEKLRKNERALTLELPGELVRVPLYEIRCLEVRQNYVTVHAKEDYTVKKPLGEFQRELDERFFRTGRSCIVNLACVRRVTRTEVFLDGGLTMPLSRGLYDAINRAIISRS